MEKIDVQGTYNALVQTREERDEARAELSKTKARLANAEVRVQDAEAENARLKALLKLHGITQE